MKYIFFSSIAGYYLETGFFLSFSTNPQNFIKLVCNFFHFQHLRQAEITRKLLITYIQRESGYVKLCFSCSCFLWTAPDLDFNKHKYEQTDRQTNKKTSLNQC
jgi:hypothetical protein